MTVLSITWIVLAAFLATAMGAWGASSVGVRGLAFVPNLLAIFILLPVLPQAGSVTAWLTRQIKPVGFIILLLMMLTHCFAGMDHVRRWIELGPIRINVSMALAPLALFVVHRAPNLFAGAFASLLIVVYDFQPDAGQAMAFIAAAAVLVWRRPSLARRFQILVWIVLASAVPSAWFLPDNLPALAHVEDILHLIWNIGALGPTLTLFAIALVIAPPIWMALRVRDSAGLKFSFALIVYLIVSLCVTELGHFPVPVIGAGFAPTLGWMLLMALIGGQHNFAGRDRTIFF